MKSTWFGDSDRKEFAKILRSADPGRWSSEIFRVFLEASMCPLRQAVHKARTFTIDPAIEEKYEKTISQVKYPKALSQAFGCLVNALENSRYDFLGTFSGELGMNDKKYRAQCFTPLPICKLMAMMNCQGMKPVSGETYKMEEPACGGGAMLIATADYLMEECGFYPWHYHMWAIDVDWKCFAMTFIQTTLLGIPCYVTHGNALTRESWDESPNFISVLHPPKPDRKSDKAEETQKPEPVDLGPKLQGSLF